jgi:hypothetical protein
VRRHYMKNLPVRATGIVISQLLSLAWNELARFR